MIHIRKVLDLFRQKSLRKGAAQAHPFLDGTAGEQVLPRHTLKYYPGGDTLIVAFDHAQMPPGSHATRLPYGYKFYAAEGHSILGVVAHRPDWYRCPVLIRELSRLSRQGFFGRFRRVVLVGGSMGGFAAAAFAALVPGCTVLAYNPQSTLDQKLVPWERRYAQGRRQNWSLPCSDAAPGSARAAAAFLIYDPFHGPDRRHIARFPRDANVMRLVLPCCGHGVAPVLQEMGILKEVSRAAIAGTLTPQAFHRLARARKGQLRYRRLLVHAALMRRHFDLAARVCDLSAPLFPDGGFLQLKKIATARPKNVGEALARLRPRRGQGRATGPRLAGGRG